MSHAPTGHPSAGDPPRGEDILDRFAPEAAARMEEAIAEAGGREVFFAGDLDSEGIVVEVRVCARGSDRAVPALFDQLRTREVVIHNHPSGNLEPSKADFELAAVYSANGHGVYIIDNAAERVYVVVEPFLQSDTKLLAPEDLRKLFSPGGPVARALPHFEVRRQQIDMMESVARAFNNEGIAIIEAPTGVGKTMAYLLPAILWAVRNRERIVVSTRTINLQEQIVYKDIPLLQRCLPEKFTACLVKGRGNYLCPRKLERALNESTLFDDEEAKFQLDALAEWAMKTEDGSREDLPFVPERSLWDRVCSESDTCTMGRCPNTQHCFVGKARRDVAKSDIVVVNHHMLFADMAIKRESGDFAAQSVLPAYQRLIFDEAHSVEDSATEYLGAQATRLGAAAAFGRFQRMEHRRERGLIPLLRAKLMKECPQVSVLEFEQIDARFEHHIVPALGTARNLADDAFAAIRELTGAKAGQIGKEIKWRLTQQVLLDPDVRQVHIDHVMPAVDALAEFTRLAGAVHGRLKQIEPGPGDRESPIAAEVQQFGAYLSRLDKLAGVLAECLSEDLAENTVRWVEIDSERDQFMRLARCPLEVAKPLAEWVYGNLETIVMTSATLTVRRKFDYLNGRLGLNLIEPDRVETQCLDSPFHFEKQAFLGIVDDLPEPNAPQFLDASVDSIREVLRVTRGHAFVLFTSFRALFHAHRKLERDLRSWGITPLRQGEATRSQLIERFRNDSASVLFGTDSFWEGVDVAGDALQCVILPKLPFRVPTEPVLEARAEAIETRGGNSFVQYSVPQAVIKFRQGFGRLIRRRSDRGAVIVLDKRIVTKFYGRAFLESLPAARLVRGPQRGVLLALDQFFHGESNPEDTT
jgi:ATP-dependent DNA helicase DinG